MVLKCQVDGKLGRRFRELAMSRFGYGEWEKLSFEGLLSDSGEKNFGPLLTGMISCCERFRREGFAFCL
jgi:hypothetical protein